MSIVLLATIGGLFSAISTSLGSFLTPYFIKLEGLRRWQMSMDFALGVMLSAVAFSLVGPELVKGHSTSAVISGLVAGSLFIYLTHKTIARLETKLDSGKLLLISALIFHNLPEGMGAGASLAGMSLDEALPVQIALSIQNVAEGLLLSLLLRSFGLSLKASIFGGVVSGLIEMSGAVGAGFLMSHIQGLLPFLLSLAGGSMMTSVLLELRESHLKGQKLDLPQFASGLLLIPLMNIITGI